MAQTSILTDVRDRAETTIRSLEKEVRSFQKAADKRRKTFERRAERRVKKLQKDFDRNPVVKRARSLRKDARKGLEERLDAVLATFRIASQGEVARLERKVGQLNRKIRELEKAQAA